MTAWVLVSVRASAYVQPVPLTVAVPRKLPLSKTRTVSPATSAAASVPLSARLVSSVTPPLATVPVMLPTLSVIAVTAPVVAGAEVSTVAV